VRRNARNRHGVWPGQIGAVYEASGIFSGANNAMIDGFLHYQERKWCSSKPTLAHGGNFRIICRGRLSYFYRRRSEFPHEQRVSP